MKRADCLAVRVFLYVIMPVALAFGAGGLFATHHILLASVFGIIAFGWAFCALAFMHWHGKCYGVYGLPMINERESSQNVYDGLRSGVTYALEHHFRFRSGYVAIARDTRYDPSRQGIMRVFWTRSYPSDFFKFEVEKRGKQRMYILCPLRDTADLVSVEKGLS